MISDISYKKLDQDFEKFFFRKRERERERERDYTAFFYSDISYKKLVQQPRLPRRKFNRQPFLFLERERERERLYRIPLL
jgi:hypothetical protein